MRILIIFMFAVLSLQAAQQEFAVDFHVKGQGGGPDVLIVTEKTFQDQVIEKHFKFKPAAYQLKKQGDVQILTSTLSSKKHGKVAFTAVIAKDGSIAGLRIWSKPGKTPITHAFSGKKK